MVSSSRSPPEKGAPARGKDIAGLVLTNVVDMPYWDDWFMTSDIIIKWHAGTLSMADLFRLHNESRPFFPRLLFLALGEAGKGRMTLQPAVSFALASLISWSVVFLGTRTLRSRRAVVLGVCGLACLLVFTPRQGENWVWGTTANAFLPVAALLVALVALGSRHRPILRFAAAALACVFATWSFANGLANWIAAAPAVAILLGTRWLAGWLALFAVLFVVAAPDEACLTARVLPDANVLRHFAIELDRLGYLSPPLVRSRRLQDIQGRGAGPREAGVGAGEDIPRRALTHRRVAEGQRAISGCRPRGRGSPGRGCRGSGG